MSAYLTPQGTLIVYLNGDPHAGFGSCRDCGDCCSQVETGQCAGGYEGVCHLLWERAGVPLEADEERTS